MTPEALNLATQLLQKYEGYINKPKWDVNAYRVGYGSDTITKPDGTVAKVQQGMQINQDDAVRDLQRRIPQFASGIENTIGSDKWNALPPNAQAALISVAYNYGSIGKQTGVVNAAKSGNLAQLAEAIRGLSGHNNGVNASRRASEADVVLNGVPNSPTQVATPTDNSAMFTPFQTSTPLLMPDIGLSAVPTTPLAVPTNDPFAGATDTGMPGTGLDLMSLLASYNAPAVSQAPSIAMLPTA